MGRLLKVLAGPHEGKGMYCFSADLLDGCFSFANMAASAEDPLHVLHANTAAIFFAGSYLEARLNELIEEVSLGIGEPYVPLAFWQTLNERKKTFSTRDKWNLIASASGGQLWDSSAEPFQSLDVLTTLRNELVHYKGEMGEKTKPRLRKLQYLSDRFKGPGNNILRALNVGSWAHDLLTCPGLGQWVHEVIEPVSESFDELLTGKTLEILKAAPSPSPTSGPSENS
ncbi:hypothetical protein [Burkholderia sp. F1]|uniref:hypothetical protein n=1 Tax=Burkholderia sp. F1 TaxID=3366817 RepID=UPI003D73B8DF